MSQETDTMPSKHDIREFIKVFDALERADAINGELHGHRALAPEYLEHEPTIRVMEWLRGLAA